MTQETVPRPAEFQARIPQQESLSLNLRIECFTFQMDTRYVLPSLNFLPAHSPLFYTPDGMIEIQK